MCGVVAGLFGYRLEPCQDMFSFSSVPLLYPWWVVCWHSLLFFSDKAREMKNDGAIESEICNDTDFFYFLNVVS